MAHSSTTEVNPEGDKARAGIQSVEVGFALLDVLAQAPGPLMLRDLASAAGMSAANDLDRGARVHRREIIAARNAGIGDDLQVGEAGSIVDLQK
jgi:hypothetical protein